MPRLPLAALLLGSAVFPAVALSQTVVLDPIVLTAEQEQGAGQIDVTPEQIEDAQTGSLDTLFRAEPSVIVGGGIAMTERVFVNGIDQQQLAVTVDGAAQNNRVFHHTGTNVIDPGLLKAVRVDAGVAPADAGFGALAGSIAYETKSALDLLEDGKDYGGKVTIGYEGNGKTATGALTLYGRQGPVDAVIYGKRATGDDYEDGDGETVRYTGADMNSYMLKLGAQMGDWRAELGATKVEDDALRPYRANLGGVIGVRPTPETRRYLLDQETQTLSVRRSQADGLIDPELRISRSESILNTADLATADITDPDYNNGTADTVSAVAQNHFQLGGATITAGLDNNRSRALYSGQFRGVTAAFREDRTNTGVFAQARGTHGRFDYSTGLRYDWSRFTGAGGQQIDTDGASVNGSVTWHATDALSVNAGYSSVFGGTQLASVYELDAPYELDGAYDDLRPTRAQNAILGLEWTLGGTTLGADLFRTKLGHARKGLEARDVESEGYHLSARQDWAGGFAVLRYSDVSVEVDGEAASTFDLRELGTVPGRILTLEARHEVMAGLSLGSVVQHALDETSGGAGTDADFASYTVVDVFAEYEPAAYRNLTLRAEVNNLFDRAYVDRASYGGDFTSVIGQQEPGRSVAVTANLRF
nr:TonB-dependent receptor [Paracoccus saliphilus]